MQGKRAVVPGSIQILAKALAIFLDFTNSPPKVTKSTIYNTLEGPLVEQTTPGAFY